MPANLPPDYFAAEKEYRAAKSIPEKIQALEEMLAIMPKHKGTDKLQADLKRRISRLKMEARRKPATKRGYTYYVKKEGAAQIFLIGPPNTGKSQLLSQLTSATPEVADYPFTTRKPLPGMMRFENIQIQLVDVPPISNEHRVAWLPGIIRNADAILLIVDLSKENLLEQVENVIEELEKSRIRLGGNQSEEDGDDPMFRLRTIVVGNKSDCPEAGENFEILKEIYSDKFALIDISAQDSTNLDKLKREIFDLLNIIRVYTKSPGKKPDYNDPVILKKGSALADFASAIHKDFAAKLKFARIWGKDKYAGQMIQRDHILRDEDVVELHI
jgi:small GTP-binding protein